jgi:hypothetical protein
MVNPNTYVHGSPTLERNGSSSYRKIARESVLPQTHDPDGEIISDRELLGTESLNIGTRRKSTYPSALAPIYKADIFTEPVTADNALELTLYPSYPSSAGPFLSSRKRTHIDEDDTDEPSKAAKRRCIGFPEERDIFPMGHPSMERRTPTPDPPDHITTEARAKEILQGLTKRISAIKKLTSEIVDVQKLLQIIAAKNNKGQERLQESRKHRKIMERYFMMVLKSDGRLHDGSHSWAKHSEARPTFVRAISEEIDTSEYVETDDDEELGCMHNRTEAS